MAYPVHFWQGPPRIPLVTLKPNKNECLIGRGPQAILGPELRIGTMLDDLLNISQRGALPQVAPHRATQQQPDFFDFFLEMLAFFFEDFDLVVTGAVVASVVAAVATAAAVASTATGAGITKLALS